MRWSPADAQAPNDGRYFSVSAEGIYASMPPNTQSFSGTQGIAKDVELAADLMNIKGSAVHLSKAIMNLVGNAAEAMPAGGVIRVMTYNRYLDTDIDRYEPIPEGDGTRFDIYLPSTREENRKAKSRYVLQDYIGTERILIVDDIPEQLDIAVKMLGKPGYQVSFASGGEEAVAYLEANQVDLVVLDMVMPPGIDGLETYQRILESHPGQKVIIASGYAASDRVKRMQQLGAGEYICKPYRLEKIGLAVRRELDRANTVKPHNKSTAG